MPQLRPVPVIHYLAYMQNEGVDAARLLQGTSIEQDKLDDPGYMIEQGDLETLLAMMITCAGDNGLGLRIAATDDVSRYGILGYSGLSSRTIREGMLEIWIKYAHAFGILSSLKIQPGTSPGDSVEILAPNHKEAVYRFCIEEALNILFLIGGQATGEPHPYVKIELAYPRPVYADIYATLFGCPVTFGCRQSRVITKPGWLNSPLKAHDNELNLVCRSHMVQILKLAQQEDSLLQKIRHHLKMHICDNPSQTDIAQTFGMSVSTLTRRLRDSGYSYRQLSDEVRFALARDWLTSDNLNAKEISFRLGFKDVSAFRRAFKSWSGQTIGEFLNQQAL